MAVQVVKRLFTVDEYYRMAEAGILSEDDRVELIEGEVVERVPVAGCPRLFTVDEYHRMAEAGILSEDERVELIEGEVVEMSPVGSRHVACVNRLTWLLSRRSGDEAIVSVQNPIRLSEYSEPEPDLALLRPRSDFYAEVLPGPADTLLVVEVMETSGEYDREKKLPLYAEAGIPEVWLVDLAGECIEVYRQPGPDGYREVETKRRGEKLAPRTFPDVELAVDEILG
jgi:hypothetical protein